MELAIMFTLLLGVALATSGLTGWIIFGPLAHRHLRDRHPAVSMSGALTPGYWKWLALGEFRTLRDPRLNGLATPAQLLLWSLVIGLAMCGLALAPYLFD